MMMIITITMTTVRHIGLLFVHARPHTNICYCGPKMMGKFDNEALCNALVITIRQFGWEIPI